ncbi:MAG: NUDIX domain-containing protein [bacterium]|nr:NUDIX domain-containing protein [bacterium]
MINNEELLFCVDEYNNSIDPKPRNLVHATGIWHRTSHIWIINGKNEILCQRRSLLKDKAPGLWEGFFGGHIPPQVSYLDHALTELEEEVGLKVSKEDLKEAFVYKLERGNEFVGVFVLNWNGDETKLKLEPYEVDQVKWVGIEYFKKEIKENKENWSVMGYEDKLFETMQ